MKKVLVLLLALLLIFTISSFQNKNNKRNFLIGVKYKNLDDIRNCKSNIKNFNSIMVFESWANNRTLDELINKLNKEKMRNLIITWEPWKPTDFFSSSFEQAKIQPKYSNKKIAHGDFDLYVTKFIKSLKNFKGNVYIRFAHEPNGGDYINNKSYYPWSTDNTQYKKSFKRIVNITNKLKLKNIYFIYSVDPLWNKNNKYFEDSFKYYYPGNEYVDFIGITTVNLGGRKLSKLDSRIRWMKIYTNKSLILTEWSSVFTDRKVWITDTIKYLNKNKNIIGIISSQGISKAAFQRGINQDQFTWDICSDEISLNLLNSSKITTS